MANSSCYVMCEGKGCFIRNLCKRYSEAPDAPEPQIPYCDPETRYMYESNNK